MLLRLAQRDRCTCLITSRLPVELLQPLVHTPFTPLLLAEHLRRIIVVLLIIWWLLGVVVVVRVTLVEAVREVFVQPHRLLSGYHRIL